MEMHSVHNGEICKQWWTDYPYTPFNHEQLVLNDLISVAAVFGLDFKDVMEDLMKKAYYKTYKQICI